MNVVSEKSFLPATLFSFLRTGFQESIAPHAAMVEISGLHHALSRYVPLFTYARPHVTLVTGRRLFTFTNMIEQRTVR